MNWSIHRSWTVVIIIHNNNNNVAHDNFEELRRDLLRFIHSNFLHRVNFILTKFIVPTHNSLLKTFSFFFFLFLLPWNICTIQLFNMLWKFILHFDFLNSLISLSHTRIHNIIFSLSYFQTESYARMHTTITWSFPHFVQNVFKPVVRWKLTIMQTVCDSFAYNILWKLQKFIWN